MIIAVDGPVAAGKGTLARRIAAHYGLQYLDTGNLYRAVADRLLQAGNDAPSAAEATAVAKSLSETDLDSPRLRHERVGQLASIVAAMPPVRAALLDYQRTAAAEPPGAVLDGRDIGTVVCPDAEVKFFITADVETRAKRRTEQLQNSGDPTPYASVLAELTIRDQRDAVRTVKAADAHLLDTTNLSIDSAFDVACRAIDTVIARMA